MQVIIRFLFCLFVSVGLLAQAPQGISYQAVARNEAGQTLVNQPIGVKFSIYFGSISGNSLYLEEHHTVTSAQGLFNLVIGQGSPIFGSFAAIDWNNPDSKFVKIDLSPTDNGIYIDMGATQLLSVPYALYAQQTAMVRQQGNNTAIASGYQTLNGNANTAAGHLSLVQNTFGINNTAAGAAALRHNTTGFNNTATGAGALFANDGGSHNTATGANALGNNSGGNFNTATGTGALYNNFTGNFNTASGANALFANTAGEGNTAAGADALKNNATGFLNTAVGSNALANNAGGNQNVALGAQALFTTTHSENNSALGFGVLYNNTAGFNNTGVGTKALFLNTTGNRNTAVGEDALGNNTNGNHNTAIGEDALFNNNAGIGNVAVGQQALSANTSGNYNVGIGFGAQVASNQLTNAVAIGKHALVAASNSLVLGGLDTNRVKVGIGLTAPDADLHIKQSADEFPLNGTGGLRFSRPANGNYWQVGIDQNNDFVWTYNDAAKAYIEPAGGTLVSLSDGRAKQNILPLSSVLSKVMQLQPCSYQYATANDNTTQQHIGLIAQELAPLFPETVYTRGANGQMGVAYSALSVIALKAIQEQQNTINQLTQQNQQLSDRLEKLEKLLLKE